MPKAKPPHKCPPQKVRRIGIANSPKRPAPPVSQDLWTNPDGSRVTDAAVLEKLPPQGLTWFAHPVYFMHRMNKAGLLDRTMNPYLLYDKEITRTWKDLDKPISVRVVDSPGFAPKFEDADGREEFEGDVFGGYAVPTLLFNNEQPSYISAYRHTGVDFRGQGLYDKKTRKIALDRNGPVQHPRKHGKEIVSFIYGRVINLGWTDSNYGRILVMANERDKGIYILAHLSGFGPGIEKGVSVEPGDVVAYVGGSGSKEDEVQWDAHLHLEYFDIPYDESKDKTVGGSEYVQVTDDNTANRRLKLQTPLTAWGTTEGILNRRNPFDHEKPYLPQPSV